MHNDGLPWTPRQDALLGTDIDRVVAEKVGRSSVSVSNRRKALGIRASRSRADRETPGESDGESVNSS